MASSTTTITAYEEIIDFLASGTTPEKLINFQVSETEQDNLAYACVFCNRFKGSDIGSIIWETKEFIRFYHPRWDRWKEHFRLESGFIQPITNIGQVTAKILRFNEVDRVTERLLLMNQNLYPSTRD